MVAGGGLIGCTIAWRLAARGVRVQVIESARPGTAASWAAAGMLAPLFEAANPSMRDLCARSRDLYPEFIEELRAASGIDVELRLGGKIDIGFSDNELAGLRAHYGSKLPDGVRQLTPAEAFEIAPNLSRNIAGALYSENDGSVDNRQLMRAAWVAAGNAGVEFVPGVSVREVACNRDALAAVVLSTGERINADALVIAAGAWSGGIRGLPQPLPVLPVRGQIVALEAIPLAIHHIVADLDSYIVPRNDGRVLIGSTVERVGFDTRTTARGIGRLLASASRAVPALGNAQVADTWAGLRPGTADDLPILGEDPRAAGVFYATGHFRNGILLAPVTAQLIAGAVCGERSKIDMTPFLVGRFHGEAR